MKYYIILIYLFVTSFLFNSYSQIGGIINTYQPVLDINLDTVTVEDAKNFQKGEKAMLFQVKGAQLHIELDKINPSNNDDLDFIKSSGIFEILIIDTVDYANNKVVFESEVEKTYNIGEAIQLIEIKEYERVSIDSEITAPAWDGDTGGVVVIIANRSITFNADINVSGKGFRGADPDLQADYLGDCRDTDNAYDSLDYYYTTEHRGALKGEGFVSKFSKYAKGYSSNANGGGGGNGKYSGGGGGSNIVIGGSGGKELGSCGSANITSGGKFNTQFVKDFYVYSASTPNPRIIFGGGGGTSNQNKSLGYTATKGGNGGGIVIIIADTIIGNGRSIIANGEDVSGVATAGAGAGGGAGSLIMAVNNYADDNLQMIANGGTGGNTAGGNTPDSLTGPGGGGGRGVIWHSFNNLPPGVASLVQYDFGDNGINLNASPLQRDHGAQPASDTLNGFAPVHGRLVLPLTGFLFNTVYDDQYICEGDSAARLTATRPKGGIGVYSYEWQKKSAATSWSWQFVGGPGDSLTYGPGVLTDTTMFRRVVTSGSFSDTSKAITIYVNDLITGNIIGDEQKICSAQSPSPLTGNTYAGGDNQNYAFQWEVGSDSINFNPVASNGNNETYSTGILNDTLYYRREIKSGYCQSYSNKVLIMVLDPIVNNSVADGHDVCFGNQALPLTGTQPGGGDNQDYAFTWQQSNNNSSWSPASGTNNQLNYNPPVLTDTMYYRRYVTSGGGLCESTSNAVEVDVLDPIHDNGISKNDTICQDDLIALTGQLPQRGNGDYDYTWLISNDNSSWNPLPGSNSMNYTSDPLTGDSYFRRVVASGRNDACIDTSNAVFIKVWNSIAGNTIAADSEYCEGDSPQDVNGTQGLSGGDGSNYEYRWQIKSPTTTYSDMQDLNSLPSYSFAYVPDVGDYYIRRRVISDVCTSFSDSIQLVMLPSISGNNISTFENVCYNNSGTTFNSDILAGGNNTGYNYQWQYSFSTDTFGDVPADGAFKDYVYSGLTRPTYFRRIVTSGACADTSDVVPIGIFELPVSHIVNTNDTVCQGNAINIRFELTGKPPWQISYNDELGQQQTVSVSEGDKSFDILPGQAYTFTTTVVADANNCEATEKTGADEIIVYSFPDALGGDDIEVCDDVTTLDGSEGYEVKWEYNSDSVQIDDVKNPKATATVVEYGRSLLKYHMYNWNCEVIDEVLLTFNEQPEKPDAGGELTLDYGTRTMLEAQTPAVGVGRWYDTDTSSTVIFNDVNDPRTLVENLVRGKKYLLVWEVSNGNCDPVADTLLLVSDDLMAPQGFSPNNDGKNDFFTIKAFNSLEEGEYMELRIINRRGLVVFYDDNYKNNWDGRSENGIDLPEGTYFYILKIKRSDESVSGEANGFVVIKR